MRLPGEYALFVNTIDWMMQNISVLMSPRSPSGFTNIKKPNTLHHPVQAKICFSILKYKNT